MASDKSPGPADCVGRWLCVDGNHGIVRYIGPVDGTRGEWLGIEWADPQKGKHRGTKDGKQYFVCTLSAKTKGSFIRNVDRIDWGQTVLEAARARYIVAIEDLDVLPQTIDGRRRGKIEAVGFDKIAKQQGDLETLAVLGLDSQRVYGLGSGFEQEETCALLGANSRTLLLANNYLTRWAEVTDILSTLGNIETLDVSANHFETPLVSDSDRNKTPKLDSLRLDSSPGLAWQDVCAAVAQLSVRSLSFGWSNISNLALTSRSTPIRLLESLEELRLECNGITDISALSQLPNLRMLDLKGNKTLVDIPEPQSGWFGALESLNLAHTGISSWQPVNHLAHFPKLKTLYIAQTPLFDSAATRNDENEAAANVDVPRAQVLGRLANITKLDGTEVALEERVELERFYLSLCAHQVAGETRDNDEALEKMAQLFPRTHELASKHGAPRLPKAQESKLKSRLVTTTIEIAQGQDVESSLVQRTESKPLIRSMLVRQLRPIAMRLARTRKFKLYLCADGSRDEWVCLDTDTRELSFYGLEDGASIIRILT
ncbi:hypothetical protein IW140_006023 [Coemansia sp. RSA 1813]|nr:hypothetical protein EV178_002396 [Coemansia sp. RSA 1646]KAJ1769581.1 hypothetical protein LPJ74_003943 [Coemansia sp. RSA 1843]KAJ2085999.1 hypothetical protein IW138_005985 [Coemansia sp. RSA 986]KAJ2215020.1 hypothetical protein EV179_002550 [Coemansia sp. RSA 487]KAJ2563652.1 hypothetical protein IW140_006023 [Coemansia sp. RSA 1813]